MIKILILSLFLSASLFCADEKSDRVESMEMLLFKIGFTSLVGEFETQKDNTFNNTKKIEQIEEKIEQLIKFTKKTNLSENDGVLKQKKYIQHDSDNISDIKKELALVLEQYKKEIAHEQSREINNLKEEIASLKKDIGIILSKKPAIKKDLSNKFRVVVDNLSVKNKPSATSKTILVLKRHHLVTFLQCDRYGWCNINDIDGYAPKHLFLPAK